MNSKLAAVVSRFLSVAVVAAVPVACSGQSSTPFSAAEGGSSSTGGSGGSSGSSVGGSISSGGSPNSAGSSSGGSPNSAGSSSGGSGGGGPSIVPTDHRAHGEMCSATRPAGSCPSAFLANSKCKADSDCTTGLNGRCIPAGAIPACSCSYDSCAQDADCAPGSACKCGAAGNACVPSGCRTDSDCGASGYCSPSVAADPSCAKVGFAGYYCHTPSDTCVNDSDCPRGPSGPQLCIYAADTQHWACKALPLCAQ